MISSNTNISALDKIKLSSGNEPLKNFFHELIIHDHEKAINLINDEHLRFSSLFILRSEINKFNLSADLNKRNSNALKLINQILAKNKFNYNLLSPVERQNTYTILKWIVETGYPDDGLSDQFDELLDTAVILLVKVFEDKSILNIIIELIFSRNAKKSFNYDLIWAIYESRDPRFLFPVVNRLNSNRWMDIELARKLLKFIPDFESNYDKSRLQQYKYANKWLHENHPYLEYTGESFQQSSTPKPYILSFEAKYLCKPVVPYKDKIMRDLSDTEQKLLDNFKVLDNDKKILLSKYSNLINKQNKALWNKWINYPIKDQLHFIKNAGGLR